MQIMLVSGAHRGRERNARKEFIADGINCPGRSNSLGNPFFELAPYRSNPVQRRRMQDRARRLEPMERGSTGYSIRE